MGEAYEGESIGWRPGVDTLLGALDAALLAQLPALQDVDNAVDVEAVLQGCVAFLAGVMNNCIRLTGDDTEAQACVLATVEVNLCHLLGLLRAPLLPEHVKGTQ